MIQIRRSYVSLVYIGIFLTMILLSIEILSFDSMYYVTWFWIIALSFTIIRRIIFWKYIIIKDDQITLHMDFKTERFPIKAVTKLFLQTDPFQYSYFQLKSGKKLLFQSYGVPRAELVKLREALNDAPV